MRPKGAAVVSLLALMVACTNGAPPLTLQTTSSPAAVSPPSPVVLEPLVLTANLSEPPARWEVVFTAPFGGGPNQLGFKRFPESVNSQPSSFAVGSDGSFLIMDRWKERVARYSAQGELIGAISIGEAPVGVSVGSLYERVRDIVVSGDGTFALMEPTGGPVVQIGSDGTVTYLRPRLNDRDLWVAEIFPSPSGLVMLVGGYVQPETGFVDDGPQGYFRFSPPNRVESMPGVPAEDGWIDLRRAPPSRGDQEFDLHFLASSGTTVQPFRVDVRTEAEPEGRALGAAVGPGNLLPAHGDVVMYMMLSPSRPAEAARYGGGRWLLRLGRSPVLWERLPEPGIPDEPQARHLALGPDGTIYLMVAHKGGVTILRRP